MLDWYEEDEGPEVIRAKFEAGQSGTTGPGKPYPAEFYPGCPCYACDSKTWHTTKSGFTFRMRMSLCPECGNKRCPKATDHEFTCSGSNEPGQAGSMY